MVYSGTPIISFLFLCIFLSFSLAAVVSNNEMFRLECVKLTFTRYRIDDCELRAFNQSKWKWNETKRNKKKKR